MLLQSREGVVRVPGSSCRNVFLVGCMLSGEKENVRINLQVRGTADEIEQEFKRILKESRA